MSFTQSMSWNWSGGGESVSGAVSATDSGQVDPISDTIVTATTDRQYNWQLDVSLLKMIVMLSTQDITLETNSSSAPAHTFALKANIPLMWESTNGYFTNPFGSTDVTALYVTNTSGATATLNIRGLVDATP